MCNPSLVFDIYLFFLKMESALQATETLRADVAPLGNLKSIRSDSDRAESFSKLIKEKCP